MRTWKDVATLVKTKSLNGRFVARGAAGLSSLLAEGLEVAFVPPQLDAPRRGTVNYVRPIDADSCEVGFDTVSVDEIARQLVGAHILAKRDSLPDEGPLPGEPAHWAGFTVVQDDGSVLGGLQGIVENPGQALLEVQRADGRGQLLVPLVDEFILDVDEASRSVTVSLPAGLLDL